MSHNEKKEKKAHTKQLIIIGALFVLISLLATGGSYLYAQGYGDKIAPGTFIGSVDVSGLNNEDARSKVQAKIDELITNGYTIKHEKQEALLPLSTLITTDIIEDVTFDINTAIEESLSRGHHENPLLNAYSLTLTSLLGGDEHIHVPAQIDEEALKTSIRRVLPETEKDLINAGFAFSLEEGEWTVETIAPVNGVHFTFDTFFKDLERKLESLESGDISIETKEVFPEVTEAQAQLAVDKALHYISQAPVTLEYTNDYQRTSTWTISEEKLTTLLQPIAEDELIVLNGEAFSEFLSDFRDTIEREAENAKLTLEDGKVNEFVSGKKGIAIDEETTIEEIERYLKGSEQSSVQITTMITEPEVKVGDLNDLGITEMLGTGTSSYAGSPWNRRRNIQNGVDLLNGILIAPGDEFSLIDALSPFTFGNGYFEELVIKGDKIEPELGGGLCQIGTTAFRATMNSGLPVTQRRNHSLVVGYYNDPQNGNPGTDATIYEPAPDYRFKNDTENFVLFQAENLVDTAELRFTFWGTNDGRSGSYTAPVVHKWIPVGETQYIDSEDLEPGVEECQEAHIGANTSFTYTIERPDGEKDETVYSSHYRPLPRICLRGVDPDAPEGEEGESEGEENASQEKKLEETEAITQ